MKKFLCFVLSLMLVLASSAAFAAVEYSLPEKWQRQVAFGNGVKGSVTVNVTGEAEWAQLLAPLNDTPLQIRAIRAREGDDFQYRIYAEDGENMVGLTQLYGDSDTIYLQSELLPDILLSMATGGDVMDRLWGAGEGTNPSLYSAMVNIASIPQTSWDGKWVPALSAYESNLEVWLEDYASAPSVKRSENGATVLVRYDVPADAVKAQIKKMWRSVLQDGVLLPLIKAQMNEEQQAAFLNPNLSYYYDQVIDALPLNGNVVLEREMTAKGEAVRTDMSFPLAMGEWHTIRISQQDKQTKLTLQGNAHTLDVQMDEMVSSPDSNAYGGALRITPANSEEKGLAVTFALVGIRSNSVDADTRSHEVSTWTLKIKPDTQYVGDCWYAFEPVELDARVHLHSKSLQVNAVTLEVDLAAKLSDAEISVKLNLITRSPWVMDVLPTEGATEISTLAEGELAQLLMDLGLNGITRLVMMNPEAVPPQPEEATDTDLEATATDLPQLIVETVATPADLPAATATDLPASGTDLTEDHTAQ